MMYRNDFGEKIFQEFNYHHLIEIRKGKCSICISLWTKRKIDLFVQSSIWILANVWMKHETELMNCLNRGDIMEYPSGFI